MSERVLKLLKKREIQLLILILLIALFFRTYQVVERFQYAHDGDLYSWIIKDIVIDHHPRLIGQLTSAEGIFIGGLFYYMLIPFFLLTGMDPVGGIIMVTILGLVTIYSYFYVFSKLFNKITGFIAAFLQSVLIAPVYFDRAVVPTTTTTLWCIWYLYTLIQIARGNFYVLPILGILIGLIWHVHIALLPALLALPVALIVSRKFPKLKQIVIFLIVTLLTSLPLILFELKHNFGQTFSFIKNLQTDHYGSTGLYKFELVIEKISKNITTLFLHPQESPINKTFFTFSVLATFLVSLYKKLINLKEILVLLTWVIGVILFFTFSSSPISEYYFSSIETVFMFAASLFLTLIFKSSKWGKYFVLLLLSLILLKNAYYIVTQDFYNRGYKERKEITEIIKQDMKDKGYACTSLSFIASKGENVGFRYFFWLYEIKTIPQSPDVPVYNIVSPADYSTENDRESGHIGVIFPKGEFNSQVLNEKCNSLPNLNTEDSVFGFVN